MRVRSLPAAELSAGECSIDGFYETNVDPTRPWILYADDVNPARARFTILHELGHHLLATAASELLDDLDAIGGSALGAIKAEESVCHGFAGRVLIPQHIVDRTLEPAALRADQVIALKDASTASWEAVAVRAAEAATTKAAVLLIRTPGEVAFAATSSRVGSRRWPRGSDVSGGGPLARALDTDRQRAIKDTFRWNLPYGEQLYCDTVRIHEHLALAVLTDRPSDGRFDILEDIEPAWKDKEDFCPRCGEERNVNWCDLCRGRRCWSCGSCGCDQPIRHPLCPRCFLHNAFNSGSSICRDCENDEAE
ncbi:MAG: ImmA/IrrE family metallo-endopeptidase [Actinobacteria bacterium]|nr:ImmA/IrrE family metallo-endopeptidase [Actinomycetota bacterium]